MSYRRSYPLERWFTERRATIGVLATAHATLGEVTGPGRPLEIGRPVAHAYVLRLVAEFQGFVRDLHDLAAEKAVRLAGPAPRFQGALIGAVTHGRALDRGNADMRSVDGDFRRLGVTGLHGKLSRSDGRWQTAADRRGDAAYYQDLIEIRNALAHGNQTQLQLLRARGVRDTVGWARSRLPGLDRMARALDRAVWEHLTQEFGGEPW